MGFPKVEFITVEDAVKVAIDRLELVEPELRLWLWDEFAQVSFTTDDQFIIGYEQAKEDAIALLTKELNRGYDERRVQGTGDCEHCGADGKEQTMNDLEIMKSYCDKCKHNRNGRRQHKNMWLGIQRG